MTNTTSNSLNSGDGTRPSTDGGVDNMGAGEKFAPSRKNAAGEDVAGPAPADRMRGKESDVEATKADDSAPFGLTEELASKSNQEQLPQPAEEARD